MTAHTESQTPHAATPQPADAHRAAAGDGAGSLMNLFDWVALRDPALAARLLADYLADLDAEAARAVTDAGDRGR